MCVTLSNTRGWGHIHTGFSLLLFHASYWYSFGHLSFLLVFLSSSCPLQFCLLATVPQSCPFPSVDHLLPQSRRVVPAHSGLPKSHRLPPFNMQLFQECVPSSMSPQLSLSSFVSLQVFSVYLLPAMAASLPEICLSWDAVGSSVCLSAALVCGNHPDCFQKWPHPAVTGTWVPTTQVPATAPAAETQPCMGKHILSETER